MLFRSPAKVNLYLRVGPRRADGFHSLISWFSSVGLSDELELTPADPGSVRGAGSNGGITLSCNLPAVPTDERNLVLRAARAIEKVCPNHAALHIHLKKVVPMGGGLGGGSSNAAIALQALNQIWNCSLPEAQLDAMAAELGSDVAFFLHLPSALCRGRGEQVQQIAPPRAQAIVLILPPIAMPTPQVYRRFDELGLGTDLEAVDRSLPDPSLPTLDLLDALVNDLERPAFDLSPELAELRLASERRLGRPVRMSGSGSTLFTLYDDLSQAQSAAEQLSRQLGVDAQSCSLAVLA
jgi:4-diphosphocytidyl-2-C-methyl-D-erythritol kinase